ncbi:MAG: dienelactone hydrolase family protein [Acidimicrobiia bacterium]
MRITLPSGSPAELARPTTGEPVAGLVVIPDIWGLRPLFDEMCQRLADEHRVTVCAIEPFPNRNLPDIDARFDAMSTLVDDEILLDVSQAADATGAERTVLIGFCMGGMYTLKATALRRFDRACAFYGMFTVPVGWRGPHQGAPLEAVATVGATPIMAVVGGEDPYTPPEDVAAAEAAGVTIARYLEAEHGFVHDASRPTHRPADAADAWSKCFAFLGI